jgi:hypothetical protein
LKGRFTQRRPASFEWMKKCLKWNFLEHTWKDLLIIAIISYKTDDKTNERKTLK